MAMYQIPLGKRYFPINVFEYSKCRVKSLVCC